MKIGHYCISTELGGAERSLLDFAIHLKLLRPDFELEFIFAKSQGPLIDQLQENGFVVHTLPLPATWLSMSRRRAWRQTPEVLWQSPQMIPYLHRLSQLFGRRGYQLIHTTGLKCHLLAGAIAPISRVPVLWHIRDIFSRPSVLTALRGIARLSSCQMIFNSQASARPLDPHGQVIYNGFPHLESSETTDRHHHTLTSLHQELDIPSDSPLITSIGILAQWKGQDHFIDVALKVHDQEPQAHFLIVGDEIYDTTDSRGQRKALEEKVRKLKLENCVHFLGFRNDISHILQQSHLFIHTSLQPEPFGRVIVEAMLNNTPVIAANDGGVPEIIRHQNTGLLCSPGNVTAYTQAILYLLNDNQARTQLVESARKFAQKHFSIQSHVQAIAKVYDAYKDPSAND